jgi:gliding motility-associated-like protein
VGRPVNDMTVVPVSLKQIDRTYLQADHGALTEVTHDPGYIVDVGFVGTPYCVTTPSMDTLRINGDSIFCGLGQDIRFTTYKSLSCATWTNWSMDTTVLSRFSIPNDSTLNLRFKANYTGWLKANISTSCGNFRDSIFLRVLEHGGPVNLGKDSSFCFGDSVTLRAKSAYFSYLWSDGSTDSLLKVMTTGQYWVRVTDACGSTFADTVQLTFHPRASIDIGPDLTICPGDTVNLAAPAGYLLYDWSSDYRLSSVSGISVLASPLVDTLYTIKAEQWPGCQAYDTIHIKVRSVANTLLGPDLHFCIGDSAVITSSGAYRSYLWNTGETTPSITVKTKGSFRLNVEDLNGCRASDTVSVLDTWPLPVVRLPETLALCVGGKNQLDAGLFTSYLWQDGSTGRVFQVSDTGRYKVQVRDIHGCAGADSLVIGQFSPMPSGFLPKDTSICSYDQIVLKAKGSFASYSWTTGATTDNIVVNSSGIYALTVVDTYGCAGNDTITIGHKDCAVGFHMPNMFTPNGDGINDRIHPLIDGPVESYSFSIFDRWGNKVFSASEIHEAWDGVYKGQKEPSQTYSWVCYLKFSGQEGRSYKGTFTLLR